MKTIWFPKQSVEVSQSLQANQDTQISVNQINFKNTVYKRVEHLHFTILIY